MLQLDLQPPNLGQQRPELRDLAGGLVGQVALRGGRECACSSAPEFSFQRLGVELPLRLQLLRDAHRAQLV
jgi:hypothetical protein